MILRVIGVTRKTIEGPLTVSWAVPQVCFFRSAQRNHFGLFLADDIHALIG